MMSDPSVKRPKKDEGSGNEVQREGTPSSTKSKRICNLGADKLSEIVETVAFVDKTLFIKAFLEHPNDVMVVLAPRRFGKTVNMNMVKEFLTGNKDLFKNNKLKIAAEEKFFNDYCKKNPVIYIDFKSVEGSTEEAVFQSLQKAIYCAFCNHEYLVKVDGENYSWSDDKLKVLNIKNFRKYWEDYRNLTENDVKGGLKDLSWLLNVYYGEPVYVLMDEFDAPVVSAITDKSISEEVVYYTIKLIGKLMSHLFKSNQYLQKGLINACLHIAQVLTPEANNIKYYEFLSKAEFSPYFGFTDAEVESLFQKDELKPLFDENVKLWYDGYKVPRPADFVIYSSWSLLNYLQNSTPDNKMLESYWSSSPIIDCLNTLFGEATIRTRLESLINRKQFTIKTLDRFSKDNIITLKKLIDLELQEVTDNQADLFLQFLTENGYFNVVSKHANAATIEVPNYEIIRVLEQKCYNQDLMQFKYRLCPENITEFRQALLSLLRKRGGRQFTRFAKAVSKLFSGKAVMPSNESELENILFTLAYNYTELKANSEQAVFRGSQDTLRLDIIVIYDTVGLIIELKFKRESLLKAHDQAVGYAEIFKNPKYSNVKVQILLGLHMSKKGKVNLTYSFGKNSPKTTSSG